MLRIMRNLLTMNIVVPNQGLLDYNVFIDSH